MVNGRWVYQKTGEDRYLEYGDKYWLGSSGVGKKSGHLHHHGGSVCPENANGVWQISRNKDELNFLSCSVAALTISFLIMIERDFLHLLKDKRRMELGPGKMTPS